MFENQKHTLMVEPSEDWSKQRNIYEHRIEMLNQQIEQYKKREQYNKTLNNSLIEVVNGINREQSRSREIQLTIINQELTKELEDVSRRYKNMCDNYENQISDLKEQLQQYINRQQLEQIETQKIRLSSESEINSLKIQIKTCQHRIKSYVEQSQSYEARIAKMDAELESYKYRLFERQNHLKKSVSSMPNQIQMFKSIAESRINYPETGVLSSLHDQDQNDMNNLNSMINCQNSKKAEEAKRKRIEEYRKKGKAQIKNMVNLIHQVKQNLQGKNNDTSIQNRSTMRSSQGQKSFYKG